MPCEVKTRLIGFASILSGLRRIDTGFPCGSAKEKNNSGDVSLKAVTPVMGFAHQQPQYLLLTTTKPKPFSSSLSPSEDKGSPDSPFGLLASRTTR